MKIPQEKWIALSPEEQDILEKMGLGPSGTTAEKISRKKKRNEIFLEKHQPYILGVYIKCGLCKSINHTKYRMVPAIEPEQHYQSVKLNGDSEAIPEDKIQNQWRPTCSRCYEILRDLEKDALIKKLTIYARYCAAVEAKR